MNNRLWALVTASLVTFLVLGALTAAPRSGTAASTSDYSYVVNGREVAVGIDPIALKSGLLIPAAMLDHVGIRLVERANNTIVLSGDEVTVTLKLGSTSGLRGTEHVMLPSAPIRLAGLVYVPAEALTPLGIRLTNESNLLLVESWPAARSITIAPEEYSRLKAAATTERYMYPSRDTTVRVEVTRLNRDLVLAPSWTSDPFLRGRVKELLDNNLLLLQVTLSNSSTKLTAFPASSYYLVDDLGNTYSLSSQSISIRGDLFGNLVSTGKSSGILVYPAPHPDAKSISLYLLNAGILEHLVTYHLPLS